MLKSNITMLPKNSTPLVEPTDWLTEFEHKRVGLLNIIEEQNVSGYCKWKNENK